MTDESATLMPGQEPLSTAHSGPETAGTGETASEALSGPQAGAQALREMRAWLRAEHARTEACDRTSRHPDLAISPHSGIAAGLAIAIGWLDHRLGDQHDSGPSVQECADADRAWDVQKAGE